MLFKQGFSWRTDTLPGLKTCRQESSRQCAEDEGMGPQIIATEQRAQRQTSAHSPVIFDKGASAIQWRKILLIGWCCNNWTSTCKEKKKKKKNLNTDLTHLTKINSKLHIDHDVKCKTTKLPENHIGENLDDLGFTDDFKSGSMK